MTTSGTRQVATIVALALSVTAFLAGVLLTLAVLTENWMEPACDPPTEYASYCAINGDDYGRALPFALATAVLGVLIVILHRWGSRPPGADQEALRRARRESWLVIALVAGGALVWVTGAVAVSLL